MSGKIEGVVETYLRQAVTAIGGMCFKLKAQDGNPIGMPDRLLVLPNGKCMFAEVKADDSKEPEPAQQRRIAELRQLGHVAVVVRSVTDVQRLLYTKCPPK